MSVCLYVFVYCIGNIINLNRLNGSHLGVGMDFFFCSFLHVFSSSISIIILVSKLNQLVIFLLYFFVCLLFRGTLSYKLTKNRKLCADFYWFRNFQKFSVLRFRLVFYCGFDFRHICFSVCFKVCLFSFQNRFSI